MPRALALCVLLPLACAAPRASLPVFGPGPVFNIGSAPQDDQANMNASLHVLWGLTAGSVGYILDGRKGLRASCGVWMGASLVEETFYHAPAVPSSGYPSEVRTDLLTRLAPCTALMVLESLR